jgi:hypothetical protein
MIANFRIGEFCVVTNDVINENFPRRYVVVRCLGFGIVILLHMLLDEVAVGIVVEIGRESFTLRCYELFGNERKLIDVIWQGKMPNLHDQPMNSTPIALASRHDSNLSFCRLAPSTAGTSGCVLK